MRPIVHQLQSLWSENRAFYAAGAHLCEKNPPANDGFSNSVPAPGSFARLRVLGQLSLTVRIRSKVCFRYSTAKHLTITTRKQAQSFSRKLTIITVFRKMAIHGLAGKSRERKESSLAKNASDQSVILEEDRPPSLGTSSWAESKSARMGGRPKGTKVCSPGCAPAIFLRVHPSPRCASKRTENA